ncbi:aminobenzoate oxygenase [Azotobacter chroococcum]|uniref:diiron oxygenase n=1 Tax=Azotobacter chroococcum TaxID=353 RepID=UPI00103FD4EE|nr:diiron oxygenase [Azotobacter chroococcum]TBW33998.1 aminobenzoate oxygenase [Azotobacter chroococcum]
MNPINQEVVRRLNAAWPRRATVCMAATVQPDATFDPARPDYPTRLVPFYEHPRFAILDDELRSKVLTWGWIGYNQRTITAEDCVVNPALIYIATELLGDSDWDSMEAIRQTLVDEHYHTLMHMRAVQGTLRLRGLTERLQLPASVTFRRLQAFQQPLQDEWKRALASVAFATVAEISVNAFLDILADDETIQPANSEIARMHNRDEYAHSETLGEISKQLYRRLNDTQKAFFERALPEALRAFVAQDYSMWEAILTQLEVPGAQEIIADCQADSSGRVIMRDYSGLHQFASNIGIVERLDFDFSGTLPKTQTALESEAS